KRAACFPRRSTPNTSISTARRPSRSASLHRATRRLFLMLLLLLILSSIHPTNSPIGFLVRTIIFQPNQRGKFEDTSINFISDIYAVPLTRYPRRGVDYSRLGITGSGNKAMVGHIMAIGSGTYRKPHFHGAGAQVIVLGGKGYTLLWPKD